MKQLSILTGKLVSTVSKTAGKGSGSTWPGHIALKIDSDLIKNVLKLNPDLSIILVAGTNGKTTTTKLIQDVLVTQGKKVFRNEAGANLLNGITSTFIKHASLNGKVNYDVAIIEVDENTLPPLLRELSTIKSKQLSIILLNLFRDQLDRYGEVNTIAKHWFESLKTLSKETLLITNGDDPMLRFIGENSNLHSFYFGLSEKYMKKMEAPHDVDFLFCPHCETELHYTKRSYSHMGIYICPKCHYANKSTATFEKLPNPLFGVYNKYNINAAALLLQKTFSVSEENVKKALIAFSPAFGRQEKITYNGKKIFLLLSKNPTGFNQSIQAILEQDKKPNVLFLLNDRVPDGRDISWIWDIDIETIATKNTKLSVSGDRTYDMALRLKYADVNLKPKQINTDLQKGIDLALESTLGSETLYILATYSAMLETRKILKGRSIL